MTRRIVVVAALVCLLSGAGVLAQYRYEIGQPQLYYEGNYRDVDRVVQDTSSTDQFVFARLIYNGLIPHYIKNWYTDWPKSDRQLIMGPYNIKQAEREVLRITRSYLR